MSHLFFTSLIFLSGMIFSVCKAEEPIEAIAFGSCLKQTRPQPIWKSVLASKPDVFVLLGDNIYGDTRDMEKLRSRWNAFAAVPGFKKLRADCRLLAIWDDHDYGENDAGREFPQKAESQKLFLDFLGEPKESERRKTPGIYDSVTLGPKGKRVQFILLDTRYFRSPLKRSPKREKGKGPYGPDDSEKADLLGEAQWKWLEESLRQPADLRIIASSIQVVSTTHGWETWGNFPTERERLLTLLGKAKAKGILVLSGDRHSAEISKLDGVLSSPLFDVTSSAMNQKQRPQAEENPNRVGERYFEENFGLLKINWSKPKPLVTMEIRNLGGKVVQAAQVTF